VHSARAAIVEGPWPDGARPQVDGLVTRTPGVCLGILTADCAPVLLADAGAGVIGAAHAGWRGAKAGILEAVLAAMRECGARPQAVRAAVGPCIRQDSYEVGPEFRNAFVADEPETAPLFRADGAEGRCRFDLAGYVAGQLRTLGIAEPTVLPHDTFADEARFFSYRRVTLAGGGDYGRLLSAITLVP
jgi:polyphenol oxidase